VSQQRLQVFLLEVESSPVHRIEREEATRELATGLIDYRGHEYVLEDVK